MYWSVRWNLAPLATFGTLWRVDTSMQWLWTGAEGEHLMASREVLSPPPLTQLCFGGAAAMGIHGGVLWGLRASFWWVGWWDMLGYGGVILTAFTPNFSVSSGFFAEHAINSTSSIYIRPQQSESVRQHLGCSFRMGKKQWWSLPILVSLSRQGLKISCDSRVHQRLDPLNIYLHHVRPMSCWNIYLHAMSWSRDSIADATCILVHSQKNLEEVDDCCLSCGVWSRPGRSTSPR